MKAQKTITVLNTKYNIECPDECPMCHHFGDMVIIHSQRCAETHVQVVYRCAFRGCESFFVGRYGPIPQPELKSLAPTNPVLTSFPTIIAELSPSFVKVYVEAEEASYLGLGQIAGPGYRKAFEFLIKDYAKSLSPDQSAEIEKTFAGTVVNNYIAAIRIQAVAKRALWLGNDETHYLRKWENHDINDLVTLIKLTVNWIEIDHLSKSYTDQMPEK